MPWRRALVVGLRLRCAAVALGLGLAGPTLGCGSGVASGTPTLLPDTYAGSWLSGCFDVGPETGGLAARVHRAIDADETELVQSLRVYGDSHCRAGSALYTTRLEAGLVVGPRIIGNLALAHEADLTVTDLWLVTHTDAERDRADALGPAGSTLETQAGTSRWTTGEPGRLGAPLGSACSDAAECPYGTCDGSICGPCGADACAADFSAQAQAHGLTPVAAGDVLYDAIDRDGDTLEVGVVSGPWARQPSDRPLSLDPLSFAASGPDLLVPQALPAVGILSLGGTDHYAMSADGFGVLPGLVAALGSPGDDLSGTWSLDRGAFPVPPGVYPLLRPPAAGSARNGGAATLYAETRADGLYLALVRGTFVSSGVDSSGPDTATLAAAARGPYTVP